MESVHDDVMTWGFGRALRFGSRPSATSWAARSTDDAAAAVEDADAIPRNRPSTPATASTSSSSSRALSPQNYHIARKDDDYDYDDC